jgi:ADP-ribose pyrophosphatase
MLPDGRKKERVVVKPSNAVAILPIEKDHCYLIKQFRYAINAWLFEAPAGTIENGETPEETAHRELKEEANLIAGTLIPKGCIYTTPGFTTEKLYLYEAQDLALSTGGQYEDDEQIEVVKLPIETVKQMVSDGRICDAKTICLIHLCLG